MGDSDLDIKQALRQFTTKYGHRRSRTMAQGRDQHMTVEAALALLEKSDEDCKLAAQYGTQLLEKTLHLESELARKNKMVEVRDKELSELQQEMQQYDKMGALQPSATALYEGDVGAGDSSPSMSTADSWKGSLTRAQIQKITRQRKMSTDFHFEEMNREIEKYIHTIQELRTTAGNLQNVREERDSLSQELDHTKAQLADIQRQHEELKRDKSKLIHAQTKTEESLQAALDDLHLVRGELEVAKDDRNQLLKTRQQVALLQDENQKLHRTLEAAKGVDTEKVLRRRNEALAAQVEELKRMVADLQARGSECHTDLTTKPSSSLHDELLQLGNPKPDTVFPSNPVPRQQIVVSVIQASCTSIGAFLTELLNLSMPNNIHVAAEAARLAELHRHEGRVCSDLENWFEAKCNLIERLVSRSDVQTAVRNLLESCRQVFAT
eukprot:GILK01007384.1.p1 GENE.GILK01007384.1~~GILK01007384.1.p1  ORF type:complete len:438 (-),score=79.48 GILK01007384.1:130-1443(-)